jgi:hypothetical protein
LNSEQEEGVVPASAPGALIRGSEQSFHLGISQEPDQPPRLALIGNECLPVLLANVVNRADVGMV